MATPEEQEQENKQNLEEAVKKFKEARKAYEDAFKNKDKRLENDQLDNVRRNFTDAVTNLNTAKNNVTEKLLENDKDLLPLLNGVGALDTAKLNDLTTRYERAITAHGMQYEERRKLGEIKASLETASPNCKALFEKFAATDKKIDEASKDLESKYKKLIDNKKRNNVIKDKKDKQAMTLDSAKEIETINSEIKALVNEMENAAQEIQKMTLSKSENDILAEYIKTECEARQMQLNMLKMGLEGLNDEERNKKMIDFREYCSIGEQDKTGYAVEKLNFKQTIDNMMYGVGYLNGDTIDPNSKIIRFQMKGPDVNIRTGISIMDEAKNKNPIEVIRGLGVSKETADRMTNSMYFNFLISDNFSGEDIASKVKVKEGMLQESKEDYIKFLKQKLDLDDKDPVIAALNSAKNKEGIDAALKIKISDKPEDKQHNQTINKIKKYQEAIQNNAQPVLENKNALGMSAKGGTPLITSPTAASPLITSAPPSPPSISISGP